MSNIMFEPLDAGHITELTGIMKRAFDEDTRIHLGREAAGLLAMMTAAFWKNGD